MADRVFVKIECEAVDAREEFVEEKNPWMITSNSKIGKKSINWIKRRLYLRMYITYDYDV